MLPLVLLALLLGACAVRPGPRTEAPAPEVTISPSAEAYSVETSADGVAWAALGETQSGAWVRIKKALPPVPPQPQPAGTHYVDPTLAQSCTTYDAATRTCGGSGKATAYPTWQAAAGVANPGETWWLRGGTYQLAPKQSIALTRAGLEGSPIIWEGYEAEPVVVKGPYDTDVHTGATCAAGNGIRDFDEDCNQDVQLHADGPADTADRASLIAISAPWQILRRVRLAWGYRCMYISAPDVIVEEVVMTDCWEGPAPGINQARVTVRYSAAARIRHRFGPGADAGAKDSVYYRLLSFGQGMHCTNPDCSQRARTRSIGGDDSNSDTPGGFGGNNADSFDSRKDCADVQPGTNLCPRNTWQENIAWGSVDGGHDHSEQDMALIGNIAVAFNVNGGPALKMFRAGTGNLVAGNLWLRGPNNARGGEYRTKGGQRVLHNLALRNQQHGFIAAESSGPDNRLANNVSYLNATEYHSFGSAWTIGTNWDGDKQGAPGLVNDAYDPTADLAAAETCIQKAPHQVSVRSCWQTLYSALTAPYRPAAGSPLIDGGTIVEGYHCPSADDGTPPEPPTSECRHWRGAAPDLGPFEAGIEGNPDKTRCAMTGGC
jgi:hypothetical protein